jgi:hypothetical protein
MKYTLISLPKFHRLTQMKLEDFCQAFDCYLVVEERVGPPAFIAYLTGLDVTNGAGGVVVSGPEHGRGDPRAGAGASPEEAIFDYFVKIEGREVVATQSGDRIKMPVIKIGALEAIER